MLNLFASLKTLPFFYEILGDESAEFSYEEPEPPKKKNENEKDNFMLHKIPKYLEKTIILSMLILINSIIFNLIILPFKFLQTSIKAVWRWSFSNIKLNIYLVKVCILVGGVVFAKFLEDSYSLIKVHHRLRTMVGMKKFAFFKILEIFNTIINKFIHDIDRQSVQILRSRSAEKKVFFSLLLLFASALHIFTAWAYIIGLSFILNDPNDFIYMICIRLNFIEFKKAGKLVKKKKVLTIVTNDIHDRFAMVTSLILVGFENYFENKLNSHNFVYIIGRALFIIATEILFDWMKGIVLLKVSSINPINYKKFYTELAIFHEKSSFKCFRALNASVYPSHEHDYVKELHEYQFGMMNSQYNSDFCGYVEDENLSAIETGSNTNTISILIVTFLIRIYGRRVFCLNMLLVVLCLLVLRSINKLMISNFVVDNIRKINIKKAEAAEKDYFKKSK